MQRTFLTLAAVVSLGALTGCSSPGGIADMETHQLWDHAETNSRDGRYEEALPYFDELLKRDDDDYQARLHRGVAYERLGAADSANEDLDHAVEVAPGLPPARLFRANLAIKQGRLDAAERDLRQLVQEGGGLEDEDLMAVHVLVGTIRQQQNKPDEALLQYQHAISIGQRPGKWSVKHYRDALYNATQIAFEGRNDFDMAWDYYSEYASVKRRVREPITPDDHYTLGMLAYLRGDFAGAREHLSQAPQDATSQLLEEFNDPNFFDRAYH